MPTPTDTQAWVDEIDDRLSVQPLLHPKAQYFRLTRKEAELLVAALREWKGSR